jgi:hypothetical protein
VAAAAPTSRPTATSAAVPRTHRAVPQHPRAHRLAVRSARRLGPLCLQGVELITVEGNHFTMFRIPGDTDGHAHGADDRGGRGALTRSACCATSRVAGRIVCSPSGAACANPVCPAPPCDRSSAGSRRTHTAAAAAGSTMESRSPPSTNTGAARSAQRPGWSNVSDAPAVVMQYPKCRQLRERAPLCIRAPCFGVQIFGRRSEYQGLQARVARRRLEQHVAAE